MQPDTGLALALTCGLSFAGASWAWLPADGQDGGQCVESSRGDGVIGPFAALGAGQDPGIDQDFQVMGDGRLGEADGVGQLAHAGLTVLVRGDQRDQAQPGGVGERFHEVSEVGGLAR